MKAPKERAEVRALREEAASLAADGKFKRAAELYARLVSLEPNDGDHGRRGAECCRLLGKKKEQLDFLLKAARGYASGGQLLKAVAMAKLAAVLDPAQASLERELAQLHHRLAAPERPPLVRRPSIRPATVSPATVSPATVSQASLRSLGASPTDQAPVSVLERGQGPTGRLLEERGPGPSSIVPESVGVVAIDVDDILIEELAPASEHLDLDHLGEASAPPPATEEVEGKLMRSPLFSGLSAPVLAKLIGKVELVELPLGRTLFEQGAPADAMYVIASGLVEARARTQTSPEPISLARLGPGDFFGEIGLLGDQPRQASIVALDDTELLRFGRDAISELVDDEPGFSRSLLRFLRERLVESVMLTSPLFAPFGPEDQATLGRLFRFVEVADGTRLLTEGERADGLYVLLTGEAAVVRSDGTLLGLLEPGDVFGEISLLQNRAAVANVLSRAKCYALKLPARYFMEVMMTHPVMMEYVATLGATREADNRALGPVKPAPGASGSGPTNDAPRPYDEYIALI